MHKQAAKASAWDVALRLLWAQRTVAQRELTHRFRESHSTAKPLRELAVWQCGTVVGAITMQATEKRHARTRTLTPIRKKTDGQNYERLKDLFVI
jgi:hypothetical protein